MALNNDDIAHLQSERHWYLERISEVKKGTFRITRTEHGKSVDDDAETLARFEDIVAGIERVLTIAKAEFDPGTE